MTKTQANEPGFVLAPCPFCGGPSHSTPEVGELAALVMCSENDCCTISGATLQAAAAAWNRRAAAPIVPSPAYGVKEALEPFAKLAEKIRVAESFVRVRASDLRRARTAYDAIGSGVKALEWKERDWGRASWVAATQVGLEYYVGDREGVTAWWQFLEKRNPAASIDEAKAAAQADFERRVLSCLSTHTAAGAGPVGEADAKAGEPIDYEWEAEFAWNLQADDANRWDALGADEKESIKAVVAFGIGRGRSLASTIPSEPEAKGEAGAGPVGETYYDKGKDADYFERLNNKDFAWALTCAAQDLNDSSESVSSWMPVTALLDGAAERIKALEKALEPFANAARAFEIAIGPDGIDDGLTVEARISARPEHEAVLSTADFSAARAALSKQESSAALAGDGKEVNHV